MIPNAAITDQERSAFLRKLDGSDLNISDWEGGFIETFLGCYRDWQFWTPGRRESTDKMRMKYGAEPEIKMPFPLAETTASPVPPADAAGCEFMVRAEGRQQRCNAPAAKMRQNGFRYCADHAEAVQRDVKKRTGRTMMLFPFRSKSTDPIIQKSIPL